MKPRIFGWMIMAGLWNVILRITSAEPDRENVPQALQAVFLEEFDSASPA
jgi:hypothetical protein